ncbi:MAG: AI-2E family transporter [Anaerorhabdus sp.]
MKFDFDKKTSDLIKVLIFSGTILMFVYYGTTKLDFLLSVLGKIFTIMIPFVFGFAIAFLLMPLMKRIQYKWLLKYKFKDTSKRKIATILSIFILVFLVTSILVVIIPQTYSSALRLSKNITSYIDNFDNVIDNTANNQLIDQITYFIWSYGEEIATSVLVMIKNSLPIIIDYSFSAIRMVMNAFIGLFIAAYLMIDKEKLKLQTKKFCYAFFPQKKVDEGIVVARLTATKFKQFIVGKSIDSLIIGFLCFIGMLLMDMDYAVLISVIIGVTNMIPIFGPFIGAVPGFIVLFIVSPTQSLIFVVWVLILQQFDGNILGPRILGNSVGLSSFWVMFSIIIGGGLFGVVGMFLAVPIFAVIYILIKNIVESKLKNKKINIKK